jgi:hypothetical protein
MQDNKTLKLRHVFGLVTYVVSLTTSQSWQALLTTSWKEEGCGNLVDSPITWSIGWRDAEITSNEKPKLFHMNSDMEGVQPKPDGN